MGHFEAARARYLVDLKTADNPRALSDPGLQKPTVGLRKLPQGHGQYDSDSDEDDGLRGGLLNGGAEDNGQVEEGVPSGLTQWFLVKLDQWMALKNGQQEEDVDVDMLSALDLADAEWAS